MSRAMAVAAERAELLMMQRRLHADLRDLAVRRGVHLDADGNAPVGMLQTSSPIDFTTGERLDADVPGTGKVTCYCPVRRDTTTGRLVREAPCNCYRDDGAEDGKHGPRAVRPLVGVLRTITDVRLHEVALAAANLKERTTMKRTRSSYANPRRFDADDTNDENFDKFLEALKSVFAGLKFSPDEAKQITALVSRLVGGDAGDDAGDDADEDTPAPARTREIRPQDEKMDANDPVMEALRRREIYTRDVWKTGLQK